MKTLATALLLAPVLVTLARGADFSKIETLFDTPDLWNTAAPGLEDAAAGSRFEWLSEQKDALRYPAYRNSPPVTFLEAKCWEVVLRLQAGKLDKAEISLFNRGDAGDISDEAKFMAVLKEHHDRIVRWAGENGAMLPAMRLAGGMKLEKKFWVRNKDTAVELRWSASEHIKTDKGTSDEQKIKFRAEYIQVIVSRFDPQNDPRVRGANTKGGATASTRDIKSHVSKDAEGFTAINGIPMVDQGHKGYCAVATSERILRYYGAEVDQHIIAQVANSSSAAGTDPDTMMEMLKKLGAKFGIKVRVHYNPDANAFRDLIKDYNRAAKKAGKSTLPESERINLGALYGGVDGDLLRTVRCEKDKGGYRSFQSYITKAIDAGIPLAWGVHLGVIKEDGLPQAGGGHMRIISGYNLEKQQLIYTDSWGAGHERKIMPLADAWTITTGLSSFEPRK